MRSPLATLGLAPEATPDQVRHAYQILALRHHPDGRGGDADIERFREVGAAYQLLVKGIAPGEGISNRRALDLFDAAMRELALELSRLGYDEIFIYRALTEEGCPADVATHAAREATFSAPRQRERSGAWSFPKAPPIPLLEPPPHSAFGPLAKLLAFAVFACASLLGLAFFLPNALTQIRTGLEPLTRAIPVTTPGDAEATDVRARPLAAPAPMPAAGTIPARVPRNALAPAPAHTVRGADQCATDRDCASGSRCTRASTHDAWSCQPR